MDTALSNTDKKIEPLMETAYNSINMSFYYQRIKLTNTSN